MSVYRTRGHVAPTLTSEEERRFWSELRKAPARDERERILAAAYCVAVVVVFALLYALSRTLR